ncbi:MAG: transglutaminase domain-containing protein [Actinobacteria bacterium]|nr:transglutaminase domain-containing protein [Actinomycetota bacterium]
MTTTQLPSGADAGQAPPAAAARPAGESDRPAGLGPDAIRTLRVLLAAGLAITPMLQMVSDVDWLIEAWLGMAIVLLPAAALRVRWPATTAQLLPGLLLLIGYVTNRYLSAHAWLGVVPTRASWADLRTLSDQLGRTIADGVAPIHSTAPARLFLTAGLAVLAILIDLLAVELRRPALTGIPILIVFVVSGAVPRRSVNWVWFVAAAIAYLLLLSIGAKDELSSWGRVVRQKATRSSVRNAFSGRRIGLIAIAIAVLLPFALPGRSHDVLADALHNGNAGDGEGTGSGGGSVRLDPLAALKGQLTDSRPETLFSVEITNTQSGDAAPFYLRSTVLNKYNGTAWVPDTDTSTRPVSRGVGSRTASATPTANFTATITIRKLGGPAPIFADPESLSGLGGGWTWSVDNLTVQGNVSSGQRISESVRQPNPTTDELSRAAAAAAPGSTQVPASMPQSVRTLVQQITDGKASPYAKARAISDYFHDPNNGFSYSLQTKGGESGNDLVDFLSARAGYCQQYAAAAAVMMRLAGVPARVVLGFTHQAPDKSGRFSVTTEDAHAWVEADFQGLGWVPFDPTPLTGGQAARAVTLPWAPQSQAVGVASSTAENPHLTGSSGVTGDTAADDTTTTTSTAAAAHRGSNAATVWLVIGLIVLLLVVLGLVPAAVRWHRRRARLRSGARGYPEPLWQELADTARDLGLAWVGSRTPRQVAEWLSEMSVDDHSATAMRALAEAVERDRYARASDAAGGAELVAWLRLARSSLVHYAARGPRWRARWAPASVAPALAAAARWPGRRGRYQARPTSTGATERNELLHR